MHTPTEFEQALLEAAVRNLTRQLDSAKRKLKLASLEILKSDLQKLQDDRIYDKRLAEDCVRCLSEIAKGLVQNDDDIQAIHEQIQRIKTC